jgi:hypothetical protein|nr:MAG TPA: structural protein [Caudoviricetes sp.]
METEKTPLTKALELEIKFRFSNIKRFSDASGIPYMTISNVLKRGVENSVFGTIQKICAALELPLTTLIETANNYPQFPTRDTEKDTTTVEEALQKALPELSANLQDDPKKLDLYLRLRAEELYKYHQKLANQYLEAIKNADDSLSATVHNYDIKERYEKLPNAESIQLKKMTTLCHKKDE